MSDVPPSAPQPEEPLSDGAVVLRAGLVEAWSLKANATNHMVETLRETGRVEWAISVASRTDLPIHDLAMEAGEKVCNFDRRDKMRASTVASLRAIGYDVVPNNLPHALIMLPDDPPDSVYDAIESTFGDIIPNPSYKGDQ